MAVISEFESNEDELENIVKSRLLKEYFKRENLMFSNRFLTKT